MKKCSLLPLIFVFYLGLSGCGTAPKHSSLVNADLPAYLRIKDIFFDTTPRDNYRISPDGKKIAWIGEKHEKKAIFFKNIGDKEERNFAHRHKKRIINIRSFYWARDSRHILYTLNDPSTGRMHIYVTDTEKYNDHPRDLTPYSYYSAEIHRIIRNDPEHILVNRYRGSWTVVRTSTIDLVRINIRDGKEELIAKNPGDVIEWITDENGGLRGRISIPVPGKRQFDLWSPESKSWSFFMDCSKGSLDVLSFTPDSKGLYALSDLGRERTTLIRLELENARETFIFQDPEMDIERVFISRTKGTPFFAVTYPDYHSIHLLDPEYQDILDAFTHDRKTEIHLWSRDDNERIVTVRTDTDKGNSWYLFERDSGKKTLLSRRFDPEFESLLSDMKPVSFKSRDGLTLKGYLTLPRGTNGERLPMVLYVHGGPWSRDYWGYDKTVQFLANRGYAVLQVNFRGSSGYGSKHMTAAVDEFAGKMHNDLIDGVRWAIEKGIADPERIGILGFSYGGYAALVGMTFTPDVFACGISINGPSNLISFSESKDVKDEDYKVWYTWRVYVGDPAVLADRQKMKEKSPLFHVHRVQRPVLIMHGEYDQRVPRKESDQMVKALKEAGKEVDYILLDNESHAISSKNQFFRAHHQIELFLGKHLGGRKKFLDSKE